MTALVIAHLYPAALNTYGDSGNVLALVKRIEWRDHSAQLMPVEPGQPLDFDGVDIVLGGGGPDVAQYRVAADLFRRGPDLRRAVRDGLPLLAVGALFQMLGDSFTHSTGDVSPGAGVFRAVSGRAARRMTGNLVVSSVFGELIGFENHAGHTVLNPAQPPLGRVVKGYGNNFDRDCEGAVSHHAIGTYLHGPLLSKNSTLADHLIRTALHRRNLSAALVPLDDHLEQSVRQTPLWHRPRGRSG